MERRNFSQIRDITLITSLIIPVPALHQTEHRSPSLARPALQAVLPEWKQQLLFDQKKLADINQAINVCFYPRTLYKPIEKMLHLPAPDLLNTCVTSSPRICLERLKMTYK